MEDWNTLIVTGAIGAIIAGIVLGFLQGLFPWLYHKFLERPLALLRHYRRHDCGHWSGSYATDRDGKTWCHRCHQAQYQ
jgi:hypothetical protein